MAGCRVKSLYYHCKEDAWTPIESAIIKLVRENPPLYTRGGRGNRTKKLLVSLVWSDIGDQLGLPEIWNRIVAEYAMVRHLHTIGYPVRHFPRANKFMNTSFTFLDPYINDIKDSDIPHNIYDIYRKRFSITGSIMKANCSVAAGPSSGRNNSALASGTPETGKSEAAGTISASGAVATAGPSGPPNKSSALGTESGSRATQSNAPAKSSTSAKSSASGKTDKPKVGLSPTSDAKKSASHSKSGKSDCKSKSGVFRPTGRKSKHK
ncbi:hypothetical protein HF086_006970 [Spodoptera exigua]|uniref:Uncharacterized protein n=1 Tax=Spodoptera exigua TaxID=7107 RepID=A0A922MIY6_SPOEX|nr:hypothetical protein HF086_006970 [Spodoptera exigua]